MEEHTSWRSVRQAPYFFAGRCRCAGSVDAANAWPGFGVPYFADGESAWCRLFSLEDVIERVSTHGEA